MTMSCEVNSMKQPIYTEFNLDAKADIPQMIAVTHTDDRNADVLEVNVRQNGAHIDLTGATVFARMVLHKDRDYLLSDSVPCTVSDSGNVLIPFDNAVIPVQKGKIKIEVNLTQADSVLTLQFPLWVSVNGSILDEAELTPESKGTVPDLLREAVAQLSRVKDFATEDFVFENLDAALQGNPNTSPSLFVMQDAETNNYKLVYMDSNDNLHVLFDFAQLPTTVEDGSVTLDKLHSGVIDSTLSTQGAAAEAKTTGEARNRFDSTVQGASSTNTSNSIYLKTGETAKITISDFDGTLATAFIKDHSSPSLSIYRDGVYKFTAQYDGLLRLNGAGTTTFIADVELMTLAAVRLHHNRKGVTYGQGTV